MISYSQWGNELYSGRRSYNIAGNVKRFMGIAAAAMLLSLVLLGVRGLNPSIEFTGGTQFTVSEAAAPDESTAESVLKAGGVTENYRVTRLGSDSVRLQTPTMTSTEAEQMRGELAEAFEVPVADVDTNSVGASWGQDVTKKALQSIVIFVVLIAVVMTFYFRSWTMSAAALIALANDMIITIGVFALTQVEVSPSTVIGFLTILGYSLYDTVVVFDKVRETTQGYQKQDRYTFAELVNLGVNQTLVRSINTSVVAVLPVASVLFIGTFALGAGTLTDISMALFVGMIIAAISSVFVASPALALLQGSRAATREHDERVLELRRERAESAGESPDAVVMVAAAPKTAGRRLPNSAQPSRKKKRTK